MKIKPEHSASEINHRMQVLTIDFEIFVKSAGLGSEKIVQDISSKLYIIENKLSQITSQENITAEKAEQSRKMLTEVVENLHTIQVQNTAEKNEKMSIINRLHNMHDLLLIKE